MNVRLAKNQKDETVLRITFAYNVETIVKVRKLFQRKYHKDQKCWSAPPYPQNVKSLEEWGFNIDPAVYKYLNK